ncbi:hypothetical protein B0H10DRAFT_1938749 [Mycena sp. CBHHK59/15]|nr:hypothetical protein B0H10DRAFT_1938749 [Mycena sp. CBHHK59/15]
MSRTFIVAKQLKAFRSSGQLCKRRARDELRIGSIFAFEKPLESLPSINTRGRGRVKSGYIRAEAAERRSPATTPTQGTGIAVEWVVLTASTDNERSTLADHEGQESSRQTRQGEYKKKVDAGAANYAGPGKAIAQPWKNCIRKNAANIENDDAPSEDVVHHGPIGPAGVHQGSTGGGGGQLHDNYLANESGGDDTLVRKDAFPALEENPEIRGFVAMLEADIEVVKEWVNCGVKVQGFDLGAVLGVAAMGGEGSLQVHKAHPLLGSGMFTRNRGSSKPEWAKQDTKQDKKPQFRFDI